MFTSFWNGMGTVKQVVVGLLFIISSLQFVSLRDGKYATNCPLSPSKYGPIVRTKQGFVRGTRHTDPDTWIQYDRFLSMRYARRPKRFKPTLYPPSTWWDIFEADQEGPSCPAAYWGWPHKNTSMSEDCLVLNVFAPSRRCPEEKLPVVVQFHPSGFSIGNKDTYYSQFLAVRGIIVVSLNYRLGILGWATSASRLVPGNIGFWDQYCALRWVEENIEHFGGDRERVTLKGESAGAVSVLSHMLSYVSQRLFKRVMAVSGSPLTFWGNRMPCDKHEMYAQQMWKVAVKVGCNPNDSNEVKLKCLEKAPVEDLIKYQDDLDVVNYCSSDHMWSPVIDGVFLRATPRNMYELLEGSRHDLMVGSIFHGATSFLEEDFNITRPKVPHGHFREYYNWRYNTSYVNGANLRRTAFKMYGVNSTSNPLAEAFTKLFTDEIYGAGIELDAILHSRYMVGRTYHFVYRYRSSFTKYEHWNQGDQTEGVMFWSSAVGPNADVLHPTADELQFERDLLDYQVNFIKNGDPNVGRRVPVAWPEYWDTDRQSLELTVPTTSSKVVKNYHGRKPEVWDKLWQNSYGYSDKVCPYARWPWI